MHVKGAPECMKISGFMHGITNPELIKRLNDNIPQTVDEMWKVTTAFLRGATAAANQSKKKQDRSSWKAQENGPKVSQNSLVFERKSEFKGRSRADRRRTDRFTPLTKTPKEILAMDSVNTPGVCENVTMILSIAYEEGVNAFLEFAQCNNPNSNAIPCPCVNCINLCHTSIKNVRYHLFKHDFDENYIDWTFHGENSSKDKAQCPNESRPPDVNWAGYTLPVQSVFFLWAILCYFFCFCVRHFPLLEVCLTMLDMLLFGNKRWPRGLIRTAKKMQKKVTEKGNPLKKMMTRGQKRVRKRIEERMGLKMTAMMVDGQVAKVDCIKLQCEDDLFGHHSYTYLNWNDFDSLFSMDELSGDVVASYIVNEYTDADFDDIREEWAIYVSNFIFR
ncbi:transposon, En/Spm-like, Transposase-associated domain protein [Artemisia annua]|uniref:Transposon, En/Spm-like, Transposase-associated domain protein n=1 Tax=Artemisia annua TaxID=35608 RepID=A0A2U1KQG7_ARTAN|nr:transposon, En/Spm-like, Transposase-associated domain protein [Artemisia annua]